jgi:hypothetical protein
MTEAGQKVRHLEIRKHPCNASFPTAAKRSAPPRSAPARLAIPRSTPPRSASATSFHSLRGQHVQESSWQQLTEQLTTHWLDGGAAHRAAALYDSAAVHQPSSPHVQEPSVQQLAQQITDRASAYASAACRSILSPGRAVPDATTHETGAQQLTPTCHAPCSQEPSWPARACRNSHVANERSPTQDEAPYSPMAYGEASQASYPAMAYGEASQKTLHGSASTAAVRRQQELLNEQRRRLEVLPALQKAEHEQRISLMLAQSERARKEHAEAVHHLLTHTRTTRAGGAQRWAWCCHSPGRAPRRDALVVRLSPKHRGSRLARASEGT